jgi:hypothetical protein
MDAIDLIRIQVREAHDILEQAIDGLTHEQLQHVFPNASIGSIGAIYSHTVFSEDWLIAGQLCKRSLLADDWFDRLRMRSCEGVMTVEWARRASIPDLDAFRTFARTVYAATDAYLDSIDASMLEEPVVLEGMSPGYTVGTTLGKVVVWHVNHHAGEICALKGLHGYRGLPF